MKLILAAVVAATLLQVGCSTEKAAPPEKTTPGGYQRFVPVPAPQSGMAGVPWTGFFALDTQVGQLCVTTGIYIPEKFDRLPTCDEDLKTYPTR